MAYSTSTYIGDGSTTNFGVTFPYINQATDVAVYVNGTATAFTWLNSTTVTVSPAPAASAVVFIKRSSYAAGPNVVFSGGSTLGPNDLNNALTQELYLAEELEDADSISIFQNYTGNLDATGRTIQNVAAPVNSTDAARLTDLQGLVAATGSLPLPTSGQVGDFLKATGTGAFGWAAISPSLGGSLSTLASASTTNLGAAATPLVQITGTTTITSFGSSALSSAPLYFLEFAGALTLTNSSSLVLPGGFNITTAAADCALALYLGGSNWLVLAYYRSNGQSASVAGATTSLASASTTDLGSTGCNLVQITGTTTIASLGSSASQRSPLYFARFSGALTLTQNATSLILPGAANITTAAGDFAVFLYLGSGNWQCLSYVPAAIAPTVAAPLTQASLLSGYKNLKIIVTSTTALTVSCDEAVLEDSSHNYYVSRAFASPGVNISTAASGALGLDTGSMAANTWYAVWLLVKANGTATAVISTSATAPTLPSGYVGQSRVGWVYADASKNLMRTLQYGRKAQYAVTGSTNTATLPVISNGANGTWSATVPTWAAIPVTSMVPPTASMIRIIAGSTSASNGTALVAPNNAYTGPTGNTPPPIAVTNTADTTVVGEFMLESTSVYVASASAPLISCLGWEDNI